MSENYFENFNSDNSKEHKEAPVASAPETEQTAPAQSSAEQAAQEPKTAEQPTYTNIYANSVDYRQPAQPARPVQNSAPYVNPYRQPVDTASQATPRQTADYNSGYYHQSFRSQTDGSHINYTRPMQNTAQPVQNTAQPVQRYAAAASAQNDRKERRKKSGGMSKGGIALLLVVCLLISGAAGFGGSMLASAMNKAQYSSTDSATMVIHKVDTEVKPAGTEALVDKTTSEISAEVADTVVEITTEVMQTNSFYGQYIAQGAGSGVIISSDGYILTNNHVIDGASSIKVTTRSGDSYDAKLIGTDEKVDIALLKIEAKELPTAVFGDSSTLQVGSKAVIIGNPLGTLGGSVTEGIISALDRSIVIDGKTMHLMQTDAAINPGNSGGGMFNGQGELTGIVVAKSSSSSSTGTIDNIGFVIPINSVLDILGDLKDYGYVRGRADTGMTFIDLTNQMYAYYYYGNNEAGVYISSVENGSNAAQAGFRQGDRVVSVDGKEISSADQITEIISEKSAGDTVTFELNRGGSKGTLELTLEEDVPDTQKTTTDNSSNGFSDRTNPFSGLFDR